MLEDWKQRRAAKRIKAGDGRPLQPFRWWQLLSGRKLFYLPAIASARGFRHAVDVRFWGKQGGDNGKAHLYVDDRHHAESTLPAAFPIDDGTIEVAISGFGLKRMHYIRSDSAEQQLTADPRSAVGRRLRLDRHHPSVSRWIGAVSVLLLIVGLGLNLLQVIEPISQIPPVLEHVGRIESPIHLPLWLNVTLVVAAALASMERGLRLRYHWLLDGAVT
ncbi:hypothetical protein SAMN04489751_3701 [Brevibacterium sandarakinum]|uniref:Uncharacterized protein n=1 Tax=Brevibacterium sandarakinum TaxID=629680 RepID=A0A1H1XFM0_BRESA|nr:hypothetical protein [Brevibacterium sandarakinum]SDT07960.1 hypothetical protein SAMN04489751_3701 [Brevibacterium sandarakinum]